MFRDYAETRENRLSEFFTLCRKRPAGLLRTLISRFRRAIDEDYWRLATRLFGPMHDFMYSAGRSSPAQLAAAGDETSRYRLATGVELLY